MIGKQELMKLGAKARMVELEKELGELRAIVDGGGEKKTAPKANGKAKAKQGWKALPVAKRRALKAMWKGRSLQAKRDREMRAEAAKVVEQARVAEAERVEEALGAPDPKTDEQPF